MASNHSESFVATINKINVVAPPRPTHTRHTRRARATRSRNPALYLELSRSIACTTIHHFPKIRKGECGAESYGRARPTGKGHDAIMAKSASAPRSLHAAADAAGPSHTNACFIYGRRSARPQDALFYGCSFFSALAMHIHQLRAPRTNYLGLMVWHYVVKDAVKTQILLLKTYKYKAFRLCFSYIKLILHDLFLALLIIASQTQSFLCQ